MRKLIAAFKISLDGKTCGADGFADWVDAWSDDYDLTSTIDACLLGAGMYPGYEAYWSAMLAAPDSLLPMTGRFPTAQEMDWARFAATTPHHVLSSKGVATRWANTSQLRGAHEVAAMKRTAGKDIYLMGGARLASSLIVAGLVDELRLIVYPVVAGGEHDLFPSLGERRQFQLLQLRELPEGRVRMDYRLRV
jgi:dihydrofolate reductase